MPRLWFVGFKKCTLSPDSISSGRSWQFLALHFGGSKKKHHPGGVSTVDDGRRHPGFISPFSLTPTMSARNALYFRYRRWRHDSDLFPSLAAYFPGFLCCTTTLYWPRVFSSGSFISFKNNCLYSILSGGFLAWMKINRVGNSRFGVFGGPGLSLMSRYLVWFLLVPSMGSSCTLKAFSSPLC